MNDIRRMQNEEPQQRLLWARRELYTRGKRVLAVQLLFTVIVPVFGSIVAIFVPDLRPYVALLSLIIAVLDPTVIDRWHRSLRKTAARLQEQFDVAVLFMQWDEFTAGARVSREQIHGLSVDFDATKPDPELVDWYPQAVERAPLYLARIICQRTNLWYDGTLRRRYGYWVLGISILLTVILLVIAMASGITVESFVLSVLAPASPIIIWGVREHFRQRDAADRLDRLLGGADRLWERARTGVCDEAECAAQSRQFQNAIFDHRSSSPLTFSWLYHFFRSSLETQMNRAADDMVREVNVTS